MRAIVVLDVFADRDLASTHVPPLCSNSGQTRPYVPLIFQVYDFACCEPSLVAPTTSPGLLPPCMSMNYSFVSSKSFKSTSVWPKRSLVSYLSSPVLLKTVESMGTGSE